MFVDTYDKLITVVNEYMFPEFDKDGIPLYEVVGIQMGKYTQCTPFEIAFRTAIINQIKKYVSVPANSVYEKVHSRKYTAEGDELPNQYSVVCMSDILFTFRKIMSITCISMILSGFTPNDDHGLNDVASIPIKCNHVESVRFTDDDHDK